EMVDRFSYVEDESTLILFEQLKAGLSAIEEGKDPQIITHVFEMKILELSGYSPSFYECVSCTAPTHHEYISSALGGILCVTCLHKDSKAINISTGTLKLLRLFQKMDIRRLGNIDVKDETRAQLKQCIRELMDRHIGIEWRSRNFLDQMDKYGI
ncbi:MAG TPA: DNA repair protein RecO, partial [Bacilli bacterium]